MQVILERSDSYQDNNVIMSTSYTKTVADLEKLQAKKQQRGVGREGGG